MKEREEKERIGFCEREKEKRARERKPSVHLVWNMEGKERKLRKSVSFHLIRNMEGKERKLSRRIANEPNCSGATRVKGQVQNIKPGSRAQVYINIYILF